MDGSVGTAVLDSLLVVGAGATLTVGVVTTTTVLTVRRIRRSPAMAAASLRFRSLTESGPRGEVVRLRLRLLRAVEGGRVAIGAADTSAGMPGEAPALFRRIRDQAATVDQQLRVLQGEDDRAALLAALPALQRRVNELVDLVRELRTAVAAGLGAVSDGAMHDLRADVAREVSALRAGHARLSDPGALPSTPRKTIGGTR